MELRLQMQSVVGTIGEGMRALGAEEGCSNPCAAPRGGGGEGGIKSHRGSFLPALSQRNWGCRPTSASQRSQECESRWMQRLDLGKLFGHMMGGKSQWVGCSGV